MFKSGITVKELIDQVQNEVDIAIDVGNDAVLQSYNGLIAGLYRDIVHSEKVERYTDFSDVKYGKTITWEANHGSEGVYRVYTEDLFELEKVNPSFALVTDRMCWFTSGAKQITLRNFDEDACLVVYHEMPEEMDYKKKNDNDELLIEKTYVPVPIDFIDMVKAKIRGDMYNISNDDDLAAKWYNIYNARIEDFKIFISENRTEVNG